EGAVELLATVSKTGDISHVKVVSGDGQLAKAATDAVKQWKYKPYLLNGEPVEIQTQITINFKAPRQIHRERYQGMRTTFACPVCFGKTISESQPVILFLRCSDSGTAPRCSSLC